MSSSKHSLSLYLLIVASAFSFFLHSIRADPEQKQNYLSHFCSGSANFSSNDPFETNLNKLFGYLSRRTPPTGFGLGSIGQHPNKPYSLALCRGDASSSVCKDCVLHASNDILQRCPNDKSAVIWYDNCLLKFSDSEFFGKIDYRNRFYMWNTQNVSDPALFNQKTRELLIRLAGEASQSSRFFAAGEMEVDGSTKLYGSTQCTRDLSGSDCKNCLEGIVEELPSCCDGKQGGRVVGASCNFRYETYPFVNASII